LHRIHTKLHQNPASGSLLETMGMNTWTDITTAICVRSVHSVQSMYKNAKRRIIFSLHKTDNNNTFKGPGTGPHTITITVKFRISVARELLLLLQK
jgi:hypothetical protein